MSGTATVMIIGSMWATDLVYHEFNDAVWMPETNETAWTTRCGRRRPWKEVTAMPERRAAKIARPCTRCFEVTP